VRRRDGLALLATPPSSVTPAPRGWSSCPSAATEDRLVGSLDLERALAQGVRAYQPGLLAEAHRGVLYVDEVNLLHDHLVDLLLDAAAMGRAHVERDGVSVSHAASFLLVGTMNPEEGELRPQLLDRFGLTVEVRASRDVDTRVEVVRRRMAFESDPAAFAGRSPRPRRRRRAGSPTRGPGWRRSCCPTPSCAGSPRSARRSTSTACARTW
jgi:Mg-chelatase subunit ChlI